MNSSNALRPLKWFLLLYACGIVYLSLYPFHFAARSGYPLFFWVALDARRQIFDFLVNVLFYIPLGAALLALLGGGFRALPAAVASGTLLSVAIECIQYWTPGRYNTLNDVVSNCLGTVIGAVIAGLLYRPLIANWLERLSQIKEWQLSATQGLFLLEWFLWQDFPFFPAFALLKVSHAASVLLHPDWDVLLIAQTAAGFAVLAIVLSRSYWCWVAVAAVGGQIVLLDRTLSMTTIIGIAAGFLLAKTLPRSGAQRWA